MFRNALRLSAVTCIALASIAVPAQPLSAHHDSRLDKAYRFDRGGWTYVHLQGSPEQIGYQHGYLLAAEIEDNYKVLKLEAEHSTKRDWSFFRDVSRTMLWPHIDPEYQQELKGIAEGVAAKGGNLDVWDIVAMNGQIELTQYYVPWLDRDERAGFALAFRVRSRRRPATAALLLPRAVTPRAARS